MQSDTTTSSLSVSRNGVLVVDGYGIRITVNRGHLVVHDGIGRARREARFARATSGLRRIVLLGRTGFVSLEALAWLSDTSAAFLQLHPDGRVLVASAGYGVDDPRLRRAQAAAFGTETGMAIARDLIARKLAGQLRVADQLGAEDAITEIARACDALAAARTPAELMVPEAAGAAAYWAAWAPIELRWARADDHRIPDHSRSFGSRASPLTGTSRTAATPAGALLNLGYALLEAEARFACLSTGLDPGLGVLHSDLRARDSLALDVMEAVRPDVDAFVLKLLRERTFRAADFMRIDEGQSGCSHPSPTSSPGRFRC